MAQKGQVAVEYHDDTADEKRNDDGRHNADGAIEVDDVGDGVETHDRVPKWIFRRNCIISRVASDDLFLIVGSIVGVTRDVQRSYFVY